MPHTVCKTCGYYRGRKVLEISPVGKKEKGKEKEKKSAKTTK